ncbi:MAG: sugar phosphate isomerase/epimerase [Planctomycetota bacterium]
MIDEVSVNQTSTLGWDFETDVQQIEQAGFQGIGVFRRKLEDVELQNAAVCLQNSGLGVSSLGWIGGFTGSDGLRYEDAYNTAIDGINEAAVLGTQILTVIAGGLNNHIRTHAKRTLIQALKQLGMIASDQGINVALEPIHPGCGEEWSFVHDLKSALEIIEQVDHPSVGLVCDLYHVGLQDDQVEWFPEATPHIQLVQIGDGHGSPMGEMNRCLLGDGIIPIPRLIEALVGCGYRGPFELELVGEELERYDRRRVLDHAREYLDRHFS